MHLKRGDFVLLPYLIYYVIKMTWQIHSWYGDLTGLTWAERASHCHFVVMSATVKFISLCLVLCNTLLIVTSESAQWLLRYEPKNSSFELNEDGLDSLSKLKAPVKIIAAIGDARIGKSTTLNFVLHAWRSPTRQETDSIVEEVFKTGDEHEPVTHGIWMSIWREEEQSIVLLDVEGIDLSDDAVTRHLSLFTALMSSGFGVFCQETVRNHVVEFLYTLPRLSENVFKGVEHGKNFGKLHVVVRGALKLPSGKSLEQVVKDKIYGSKGDREMRTLIAKYFPAYETGVSELPFRENPDTEDPKYWQSIKKLSGRFESLPDKTSVEGARVDGAVMTKVARILAERMTNNSWMDIGNIYSTIEKLACDSSYHTHIEPVLREATSAKDIEDRFYSIMENYTQDCKLKERVWTVEKELKVEIKSLREVEKLQGELDEERRKREEAEEKQQESCGTFDWKWLVPLGATVIAIPLYFSDIKLKQDITTITPSRYDVLGLREVAWAWNEDARGMGLSGKGRGLIAQEVEQLYPWAVVTGHDGYKRVNYAALELMVAVHKVRNFLGRLVPTDSAGQAMEETRVWSWGVEI